MSLKDASIREEARQLVNKTKDYLQRIRTQNRLEEQWRMQEKAYYSSYTDSGFTAGLLQTSVERIVPKYDKAIFPPDGEWFEARAKIKGDDIQEESAVRAAKLLKQQFKEINLKSKLVPVYREVGIHGTTFIKYFWDKRERQVFKRENGKRVLDFEVDYDNPDIEVLNIHDVFVGLNDPELKGPLIEQAIVNYDDIFMLRDQGVVNGRKKGIYDPEAVKQLKEIKYDTNTTHDKTESDKIKGVYEPEANSLMHKVMLNIYWGPVPKYFFTGKKKDKESGELVQDAHIVTAGNDKEQVVLRMIENPFDHQKKPYIKGHYIKVAGRTYGIGIINPIAVQLAEAYDTTLWQGIKNRTLNIKQRMLVQKNSGVDFEQLSDLNNSVVETLENTGIQPLNVLDMTAQVQAHAQIFENALKQSTGATDFLGGIPVGKSLERTAEGVATLTSGGLERFELAISDFEHDVLIPLVKGFWRLNQQFLPIGKDVETMGEEIIRVLPEEIALDDFDINFIGVRDMADRNFKLSAINAIMQNPIFLAMAQTGQLLPMPLLKRYIKLVGQGDIIPEIENPQVEILENTPEGEQQLLLQGQEVRVGFDDNHEAFIQMYQELLQQEGLPDNVQANIEKALQQRRFALKLKQQVFNIGDDLNNG